VSTGLLGRLRTSAYRVRRMQKLLPRVININIKYVLIRDYDNQVYELYMYMCVDIG